VKIGIFIVIFFMIWVVVSFLFAPFSYEYISSDGGFYHEGRDVKLVEYMFKEYQEKIGDTNVVLYRTTKRNPLLITEWHDYLTNRRWKYSYKKK